MNKTKPILFSTPMVVAILNGSKTQTRRIIKSRTGLFMVETAKFEPDAWGYYHNRTISECDDDERSTGRTIMCPYGEVGDRIWVREKWMHNPRPMGWRYHYYAANEDFTNPDYEKWKPSIHMPKDAARISLEITDIRIERVQDITEEDAKSEGVRDYNDNNPIYPPDYSLCPKCGGQLVHGAFGENYGLTEVDCFECDTYKKRFKILWNNINGQVSWDKNVWVWVVTFKQV